MNCPNCKGTNLVISERKGIEIDYCPTCRGVWLDRGELDKIIERTREDEPEAPRPTPADVRYRQDEHHKPYKKKKSFLDDLFD